MENILLKYMAERYDESKPEELNLHQLKAFITISREYGCPAKDIATILVKNINSYNEDIKINQKWNIISKEILDEAAKALNVHPDRISKFFKADKKNTIDEILTSLSVKYYHSNLKIKKTLTKIIQDFATKGNVIIVGRGGVSVTNNLTHFALILM